MKTNKGTFERKYDYPDDAVLIELTRQLGTRVKVAEHLGITYGALNQYCNRNEDLRLKLKLAAEEFFSGKKHNGGRPPKEITLDKETLLQQAKEAGSWTKLEKYYTLGRHALIKRCKDLGWYDEVVEAIGSTIGVYPEDDELVEMFQKHKKYSAVANKIGKDRQSLMDYVKKNPDMKEVIDQIRHEYYGGPKRVPHKVTRVNDPETAYWINLLRRDLCSYCNIHPDDTPEGFMQIDHIEPLAHGGDDHWSNMTAACRSCNAAKGDKSLLMFLLWRREQKELQNAK